MVFVSKLQQDTLRIVDDMIEKNKTFEEIQNVLYDMGYSFRVEIKNGYMKKSIVEICKDSEYSFVDLKRRRNGLATWETHVLS